jgi:hypothetical protein
LPKREVFRTTLSGAHPEFDAPKGTLLGAFRQFLGIFGPQGFVTQLQTGLSGALGIIPHRPLVPNSVWKSRSFQGTGPALFASRGAGTITSARGITEGERAFLQQFRGDPFGRRTRVTPLPASRITIR